MRRLRISLGVLVVSALALGSSQVQADLLPFSGSLVIQIGEFAPIVIAGSGIATAKGPVGSHFTTLSIPAARFSAAGLVLPVTDPAANPIRGVQLTLQNGAGIFDHSLGYLGGQMPLYGVAKVCLLKACAKNPAANVTVPLSVVGEGGTVTQTGSVSVTVRGSPWVVSFGHGPASATTTPVAPSGRVFLISPVHVTTSLFGELPASAGLSLHFVPEPSTLLLLAGGIAGLVLFGRTKRD